MKKEVAQKRLVLNKETLTLLQGGRPKLTWANESCEPCIGSNLGTCSC